MNACLFPDGEVSLSPTDTTTEVFQPITDWCSSLEALSLVTVFLWIKRKTGNFQCRLGIESCQSEHGTVNQTSLAADSAQMSTLGVSSGKFYRFDPNGASDGNIDAGTKFRLGILYSSSTAVTGQGVVRWEGMAWR